MTRAQILALNAYNTANQRARQSYYADGFAATRETGSRCADCRRSNGPTAGPRRHTRRTGLARWRGHKVICTCWLDDHRRNA